MSDLAPATLVLLTFSYPLDQGEEFLNAELRYLAEKFENIVLIPMLGKTKSVRALPAGNITVDLSVARKTGSGSKFWRGSLKNRSLILEELKSTPRNRHFALNSWRIFKTAGLAKYVQEVAENHLKTISATGKRGLVYSYWLNQAALGGLHAARKLRFPFISRAHGGDVYAERLNTRHMVFHRYTARRANRIFTISEHGANYLHRRYKLDDTVLCRHLGVHGPQKPGPVPDDPDLIRIVSCSSVIPLKRVQYILQAVSHIAERRDKQTIEWKHFGDGVGFKELKKEAEEIQKSRQNLSISLSGYTDNEEIKSYYKETPVDAFINFSTSEGIPVTIMEAFSYGIPALAPSVGGIPEIVDTNTGLLVSPDLDAFKLSGELEKLLTVCRDSAMRTNCRKVWEDKFSAEKNFREFAEEIFEMASG